MKNILGTFGDYWNYYSTTECYVDNVNVFWGVTREEYNQIVSGA